jgi:allantoate deiminase
MGARRDALAAASEMILAIERLAGAEPDLVATVGRMKVLPGVQNVIPGRVEFTIDMRGPADADRRKAHARALSALREVAGRRNVAIAIDTFQENPAVALDPVVIEAASQAIAACGCTPLRLPSGAGHDAGIMTKLCPSGMIFVRCRDGVSHNPAESITVADADLGARALLEAVRGLDRRLSRG